MSRVSAFASPNLSFAQAVTATNNTAFTTNSAATNKSSLSACVDFFFLAGASRGKDIRGVLDKAFAEDRDTALRILLWTRDCRGGAGERQTFRDLWKHLYTISPDDAARVLMRVPELGRWDDVLVAYEIGGELGDMARILIEHALLGERDRLCAKWMPRKGTTAARLRKDMGLTPKSYRKLLVGLTDVVETKMCAKLWDQIEFGKLPSLASARYQKAFNRNAAEAYAAYKASLVKGESKVNAGAIFPHDVLKGDDRTVREAQWEALPDYLGDEGFILPMVDVSGSMTCKVGGDQKASLTCMDVSVALGLYLATKQNGPFANLVLTFSGNPKFVQLTGNLENKLRQIRHADWAMNTDIEAAFNTILKVAVAGKVRPEDMPKKLLILSDMEFDAATRTTGRYLGAGRYQTPATALDMVKAAYKKHGYDLPHVVFWNLNGRAGNCPATVRDDGTALVSGFSPAILKAILKGETITPISVMKDAVGGDRYVLPAVEVVKLAYSSEPSRRSTEQRKAIQAPKLVPAVCDPMHRPAPQRKAMTHGERARAQGMRLAA